MAILMDKDFQDIRRKANKELLEILTKLVNEADGHLRFSQILSGYGFVKDDLSNGVGKNWYNEFYAEPDKVLERVKSRIKEIDGDDNV